MAIKIPRYESQITSVSGDRPIGTSASASQALTELGKQSMQLISNYADTQNKHLSKIKRLEINTNKALANAEFSNKNNSFFESLDSREDFLTPDNWLIQYEQDFLKDEKKYKSALDQQTWSEFSPLFYNNYFETKNKIRKKINQQKLNNGLMAINQADETYKQSVENAGSLKEIEAQWELHTELTLKSNVTTGMYNNEKYQEKLQELKKWTNDKYVMFQADEGLKTMSPNGTSEIDYGAALQRLKDSNFKIKSVDGSELTPDDDVRKEMIKNYKTLFDNQVATHKSQKEIKDRDTIKNFTNTIIGLEANDKDSIQKSKTFLQDLKNSNLDNEKKLKLKNAYNTAIENLTKGTSSWNTPQALQAKAIVTSLVLNGAIDTEKEREVILDLLGKGLLKSEDASKLYSKSIEMAKSKNDYKSKLIERAEKVILKELGSSDIIEKLDNLKNLKGESRFAALQALQTESGLTQEAFEAINNLYQIVAEGEKKGFSYENMLANQRSPNYLINDIIDTYKAPVSDAKFKELSVKIKGLQNVYRTELGQQVRQFDNYYILPSEYFVGKNPSLANLNIPPRKENEDIFGYLKRVKTLIKTDSTLPSVITGDTLETIDISDINIVPKVE